MRISKDIQETVKFLAGIIQTLFIVLGGGWAVYTFATQQEADIKATQRELARPYYEKQLSLYLDASRVVAHLAKQPTGREKEELEARFWELYWGELAFVESNDIELLRCRSVRNTSKVARNANPTPHQQSCRDQQYLSRRERVKRSGIDGQRQLSSARGWLTARAVAWNARSLT
jgi:hypothetical protein